MRMEQIVACGMLVVAASSCVPPAESGDGSADGSTVIYPCESGRAVAAAYPSDSTAIVRYKGKRYEMRIAISGSGARYVGGGYEWWTRGTGPGATGLLGRITGQELTASETLETCAVSPAP
jgi:membrane-bound inhibitor of C-type lysozyme